MALMVGLPWFQVARADLNDGLVAYYPFNGNATDESGNGNDGTVNGATLTTDRFGNVNDAYDFDGINDYILVNSSDSLNIDHRLTIAAWIKKDSTKRYAGIVGNDWSGYTFMFDKEGNQLRLELAQKTAWVSFHNSHTIENNTWYYVVVTFDSLNENTNKVTFYVNGQKGNELPTSYSDLNDMSKLYIGYQGCCGSRYFDGNIDDVRIYNRALSECEIKSLYTGKDECKSNLLVELANFTATPIQNDIRLDWETTSELDTAGFFVWRGTPLANGECTNDSANYQDIMQMSFDNARGDLSSGATYSRTDSSVMSGTTYCYLLEDIEFDGDREFHWNFIDSATAE
jgi:hypothetical protein